MVSVEIPDGGFLHQGRELYTNLWPMKDFWGSFSAPISTDLGHKLRPKLSLWSKFRPKLRPKLNLSWTNKQPSLGENRRKPEQDTSKLIWVKVNNSESLPWLWSKPETVAAWISQKDLTQIHFQLNLETVLNVLYIFVQVLLGSQWNHKLHFKTFFTIVHGRITKKSLSWKMAMEPHFPLVVCSME